MGDLATKLNILSDSLTSTDASLSSQLSTPPRTLQRGSRANRLGEPSSSTPSRSRKRTRNSSPTPGSKETQQEIKTPRRRTRRIFDAVENPAITSPYFPPTPTTPARKPRGSERQKRLVTVSPYFTRQSGHLDPRKSKKHRKQAALRIGQDVLPLVEPPELWWETEGLPVSDVNSLRRFERHSRVYYQLWTAKPKLIQERVSDEPWKLLIAVMLLNKTSGKAAIPIFWSILDRWPTPFLLSQANEDEVMAVIRSLGLQRVRSKRLILLSKMYVEDPPDPSHIRPSTFKLYGETYKSTVVSHLPGAGAYALDSFRIFYTGNECDADEWMSVMPSDKELIRYLRWKWAFERGQKWDPNQGVTDYVDADYLKHLLTLL